MAGAIPGQRGKQAQLPLPSVVPTFVEITEAAGIRFHHHHGGVGEKHLPETMGAGVAWLDYDGDGIWDLYFVDSGVLLGTASPAEAAQGARPTGANVLYRGGPADDFSPVPDALVGDRGYGMGVAVADYDGDGWPDLLITNFGPNALYRNNGDGTFENVTETAGIVGDQWSASAGWGDLDGNGLPDLYVANYVVYALSNALQCGTPELGTRSYCHIDLFDGVADRLYRNRGDGSFEEISEQAGVANALEGKGLGVVMGDLNDDGLIDIYVANDTAQNFLYLNRGGFVFEDTGLISGAGYSENGTPQAGMGTDLGDIDGDGKLEIVVTNFAFEPVNLYRLAPMGGYLDDAYPLGVGEATLPVLGFGVLMSDLDGDGDLDLAMANGHILDNVSKLKDNTTYPLPNQVFVNRLTELRALAGRGRGGPAGASSSTPWRPQRGLLTDVSALAGEAVNRARVSRGLAAGDADGDGWPDLAVTNSNGAAELLRNATDSSANRLVLRLRGRAGNRDALGARVWITPMVGRAGEPGSAAGSNAAAGEPATAGQRPAPQGSTPAIFSQMLEVKSSSSYCSQNATDLYVGLGEATAAILEIRWPGKKRQKIGRVDAGQLLLVVEGRGVVASRLLGPYQSAS
ncbi:MAG: CRTAC1 family protein [Acidobacteriota bacterium]